MYEFETEVDFLDEIRPCSVGWNWVDKEVVVRSVEIVLVVESNWTPHGEFKIWREKFVMDVKTIVSDEQIYNFASMIKADLMKRTAEDYDDGKMQDWEEKNRRLLAA